MTLGGVLDECDPRSISDGFQRRHVRHLAVEMYSDHGRRPRCQGSRNLVRVDEQGSRVNVYETRGCPGQRDGLGCRDEGVGQGRSPRRLAQCPEHA